MTFATLIAKLCLAQAIDYSPVYRDIQTDKSFRFSYENDFFSASDRDYTQGVYIEIVHPRIKKFVLSRILWQPFSNSQRFGVAIETDGYTPNRIDKPEIQYYDRPYASTMLLRTFNTGKKAGSDTRITNSLTLGVLGPWAAGKEIQESIHRWIGYTKPLGWHNQVQNEPVLNYQVNYEHGIAGNHKNWLLTSTALARAGTLSTKAAAGLAIMGGTFSDPYADVHPKSMKLNIYVYEHAMLNFVGYDATLQGGLINKTSPYVIANSHLKRLVFQNRFGLVINYRRIMMEYWQSFLTREFATGIEPKTGGLQFAIKLN